MKIIILLILIIISFGTISYFYAEESNREIIHEVYRELVNFTLVTDYRERHLFLYTNRYFFPECKSLNRSDCRAYLSTFGWRLAVNNDIVRFNSTTLDAIVNFVIDNYNKVVFGMKLLLTDFGYYYRIWLYKAEVVSTSGFKRAYFPEMYEVPEQLFNVKLDYDMVKLIETPSVLVLVYYNALKTILHGWIGSVWLLFYLVIDETISQLLFASTLVNMMVWVTREVSYYGVNKITGGHVKFWMYQKFTSLLVDAGIFDLFNNGLVLVVLFRIVMIMLGLPHLFNFGAVYFIAIIMIYCFYYLLSHMQTKIKYQVELKISADVKIKQGNQVDFGFYNFSEKLGLWFVESFWNMTPLIMRLYRGGWEFRPFHDLTAPTRTLFYIAVITLPVIIPIMLSWM